MRVLVLGGSVFLSRAVAAEAVRRGHDVVAACRGSHPLPEGVTHARLDRDDPDWTVLEGDFDAVFETRTSPSWVAAALERLAERAGHWTYVSSLSAYEDETTPGGSPATLPVRAPLYDEDEPMTAEVYGGRKVACEQLAREHVGRPLVARPGLIVGPGDRSGRFTYWPLRLAAAGAGDEVLAPGEPDDPMQVVDVRDQAAWHVHAMEQGIVGTYDVVGPPSTMATLLAGVASGVGSEPEFVWVPGSVLASHDIEPWMGERSVPMWLPQPDHAGMVDHDDGPVRAAGLRTRPVADTAADTLAWVRGLSPERREAVTTGIDVATEQALLAAWRAA